MWLVYMGLPIGSYADVLPLPAGLLEILATGEFPAPITPRSRVSIRSRSDQAAIEKDENLAHGRSRDCAIIFGLLIALMLTGMPISISLGLTVLTFLFTMTEVPIESVALKLFTGHREVRDHGDPVLHPGRQFPDARRRRQADDQLRHRLASATGTAASASPASWPARCSRPSRGRARRRWWRSARSFLPAMVEQGFRKGSAPASSPPPARSAS